VLQIDEGTAIKDEGTAIKIVEVLAIENRG
jgi:hypothetical protein